MSRMGSARIMLAGSAATLVAVLAMGFAGAGAAGSTPTADAAAAGASDRAIVEISTPPLPSGDGAGARERWRELRARSGSILGRVADRNELAVVSRIPETGQITVDLGGETVRALRARLVDHPRVDRVEADRAVEFRYSPNDWAFGKPDIHAPGGDLHQWNLVRSGGIGAWDLSKGVGAEVAVIDTGTYTAHPDLFGRISGSLDCTGTCSGTTVTDGAGHGTHVAGLACADSDNTYALASLGFDCSLFPIRIDLCDEAAAAIVAAANRGSDAINMSFGNCGSSMADELSYAWAKGSVLVAAGDNTPVPPPSWPQQSVQPEGTGPVLDSGMGLVVTAAKYDGTRAAFAQQTSGVSVAAYGAASDQVGGNQQGILSTFPPTFPPPSEDFGGVRTTVNGDNRFAYLVGTSMATPQVSGVVALMRAANQQLSNTKLIRLIKLTSSQCGVYGNGIGWGVVNAQRAVAAALDREADPPGSKIKSSRRGKLRIKRFDKACHKELRASGVKKVRIFASRNGKAYRLIGKTAKKVFPFRPKRKGRYRFYSIAVDKDGNEESVPSKPDKKLRVKRPFRP